MNTENTKKESTNLPPDINTNKAFSSTDNNQSPFITDISLSRSFLTKRNTAFNKREALKLLCINPKEIISNVNESYEYMKQNPNPPLINSIKNNKMLATITRFNEYKERSKKIGITSRKVMDRSANNNNNNANNTQVLTYDHIKESKMKEMSILFSKTAILNENEMLINTIREMKFYFPHKCDEFNEYFKYNSFIINSENKQVQLFNILLDLIIDILKGSSGDIHHQMINALFEDFIIHLSHNSLQRAEFLSKIWSLQQEYIEESITKFKRDMNEISIRYECINDENIKLKERIKTMEKELSSKQSEISFLSKENSKMKGLQTEKEKKLSDASQFIKEISSELKNKTNAYNDLITRFNLRVNPTKFIRMNTGGGDKDKDKERDRDRETSSLYNESVVSNHQSTLTLHNILNKTNKITEQSNESMPLKRKNSKFVNNLKSKIKETTILISENKKREAELNVFASNFDVMEKLQSENNKDDNNNTIHNANATSSTANRNKLELYMNKGMNINDNLTKSQYTQTDITGMVEDIDSNNLISAIQEKVNDSGLISGIKKVFSEYDLVFKENSLLKNKIENIEENNEQIIETYTNIFQTFLSQMKNSNMQIKAFASENMTKIKGQSWIGDFLQSIEKLNQETVADNTISPIYNFISKPELMQIQSDIQEIDPQTVQRNENNKNDPNNNNNTKDTITEFIYDTNFESIQKEFFEQCSTLKLNLTLKKTIKRINAIYFEMIESIYFKHDRLHFDHEDHFIEFGEVIFQFFIKNFGLEKLARKKCIDFLKALMEYEPQSKRITNFIKLLQIKRESMMTVKKGRERRASLGGQSNYNKYLTTFILRQMLLMIQYLKVNSFFIKEYTNEESNSSQLVLLYPKLYDSLIVLFDKINFSPEQKSQLLQFIEKSKFSISKSLNQVLDFDDLFEKVSELLIQYELSYNKTLRSIFNSVDIESKGEIDFIDCLVLHEYVFSHKLPYQTIERLFNSLKNTKHKLTFEYFETFVIESDCFDTERYGEFINTKGVECRLILNNLKDELEGNQVVILDHFATRLNSVNIKNANVFLDKIKTLKGKIISMHKDDLDIEHFISIKLLDRVSLFLFNENKVNAIFNKLECVYTLIDDSKSENENYIWAYIKKQNWIKI